VSIDVRPLDPMPSWFEPVELVAALAALTSDT
jgi:hypothetical protein